MGRFGWFSLGSAPCGMISTISFPKPLIRLRPYCLSQTLLELHPPACERIFFTGLVSSNGSRHIELAAGFDQRRENGVGRLLSCACQPITLLSSMRQSLALRRISILASTDLGKGEG